MCTEEVISSGDYVYFIPTQDTIDHHLSQNGEPPPGMHELGIVISILERMVGNKKERYARVRFSINENVYVYKTCDLKRICKADGRFR